LKARLVDDVRRRAGRRDRTTRSRCTAIAVGVAVPVCAIGIYLLVGSPQLLQPATACERGAGDSRRTRSRRWSSGSPSASRPIRRIVEGWMLLARSYARVRSLQGIGGRRIPTRSSCGRATRSCSPTTLMRSAWRSGRRLEGEPEKLIARALEIDPRNLKALALAGTVAFERKDYKSAAAYWERMLPLVPPDSDEARSIRANADEARALAEGRVADKRHSSRGIRRAPKARSLRSAAK
jgi:cytochrome c-type biogenesis protein CcmH